MILGDTHRTGEEAGSANLGRVRVLLKPLGTRVPHPEAILVAEESHLPVLGTLPAQPFFGETIGAGTMGSQCPMPWTPAGHVD